MIVSAGILSMQALDPNTRVVYNAMDGKYYTCININGTWWATENYKDYCQFSEVSTIQAPWRVPTQEDFQALINNFRAEDVTEPGYWVNEVRPYPTNASGLSFRGMGYKDTASSSVTQLNHFGFWWRNINFGDVNGFCIRLYQNFRNPTDCYWEVYSASALMNVTQYGQLRLIYDP